MDYEVGKKYLVDVAVCKDNRTGRKVIIPIQPLRHKDAAFGVNNFHYHVDCRFAMTQSLIEGLTINNFKTLAPLWDNDSDLPEHQKRYRIRSIEKRTLKCVSVITGFDTDRMKKPIYPAEENGTKKYFEWYKSMIGKSCAGRKCPHYGTEMINDGNRLICPMHNLVGDIKTEKIIPAKEFEKQLS